MKQEYPKCFGVLDIVFPEQDDGLRHTPQSCMACPHKTLCLRNAMRKSNGLKFQEEYVDRAYTFGMIGFLQRWSTKKDIHRKLTGKRGEKGKIDYENDNRC